MSEPVGADLPEARDGEGQLSKDALRSPAPGPPGMSRWGGWAAIRATSPACETGLSDHAGADLPEARDGEG